LRKLKERKAVDKVERVTLPLDGERSPYQSPVPGCVAFRGCT